MQSKNISIGIRENPMVKSIYEQQLEKGSVFPVQPKYIIKEGVPLIYLVSEDGLNRIITEN